MRWRKNLRTKVNEARKVRASVSVMQFIVATAIEVVLDGWVCGGNGCGMCGGLDENIVVW